MNLKQILERLYAAKGTIAAFKQLHHTEAADLKEATVITHSQRLFRLFHLNQRQ